MAGIDLSQIGENFPAPNPEDYEEDRGPKPEESLIHIDKSAFTVPTTTEKSMPTLFPDLVWLKLFLTDAFITIDIDQRFLSN